jgi:MATE family multidrug resistance protein
MSTLFTKYFKSAREAMQLAMPIIAGQLGMILMGFFDTVQVGKLGADYIAATGVGSTVYWISTLLGLGTLMAISPLVSEARGAQKDWRAIGIYHSGLKVALGISVLFLVVVYIVTRFFHHLGQEPQVADLAIEYLFWLNLGTPVIMFATVYKQLLDGLGRTAVGMWVNILALLLNVLLNWLLIYGHWGFPALGISGAAIASVIARLAMLVALYLFVRFDQQIHQLKTAYNNALAEQHNDYSAAILRIGIPYGLQMFFEIAAFGVAQIMAGWLGKTYSAAHQMAINLASITFMITAGLSAAGTIMTGYHFGAKSKSDIRVAAITVVMLTFAFELTFAGIFIVFNQPLATLYTDDVTLLAVAPGLILLAAFFQLSDGLQSVASGLLRGIQDVKIPSIMAFVSYWLIMIPACYLLAFTFGYGVKGIWIGFIIGLSFAASVLLLRFHWVLKRLVFEK